MKIELIPVIELPTFKYKDLENISDIEERRNSLLERNYSQIHNLNPINEKQYKISDISDLDLIKAIELHKSDLPIEDSCALFGGYALKVNDEIVLYPQCCGLLSEINDWKKLLNKNFEAFYLAECHPSPKFAKIEDEIHIECEADETGPFQPKTKNVIVVNYNSLLSALRDLIIELEKLSEKINNLSSDYKHVELSKILIWNDE